MHLLSILADGGDLFVALHPMHRVQADVSKPMCGYLMAIYVPGAARLYPLVSTSIKQCRRVISSGDMAMLSHIRHMPACGLLKFGFDLRYQLTYFIPHCDPQVTLAHQADRIDSSIERS